MVLTVSIVVSLLLWANKSLEGLVTYLNFIELACKKVDIQIQTQKLTPLLLRLHYTIVLSISNMFFTEHKGEKQRHEWLFLPGQGA